MKMKLVLILMAALCLTTNIYSQTLSPTPYCAARVASLSAFPGANVNDIKIVKIGTLNNNSGPSYYDSSEYVYYNNIPAVNLQKGVNIPATFTCSRSDGEMDAFWIFIDYNFNSAFEASELVGQAPASQFTTVASYGPNIPFNFSINIPASAQTGQTRMRILFTSDAYLSAPATPTPCNSNLDLFNPPALVYGEIEDYDVNIMNSTAPTASFSAPGIVCKGSTLTFSDNSTGSPTAWSWTLTGCTPSISTVQNPTVICNTPGIYSITLSASNTGGTSLTASKTLTVSVCTGIEQVSADDSHVMVYPNPSNGYFNLTCKEPVRILINDLRNSTLLEQNLEPGNHIFNLEQQPAGMYFLLVYTNEKQFTVKLIKE